MLLMRGSGQRLYTRESTSQPRAPKHATRPALMVRPVAVGLHSACGWTTRRRVQKLWYVWVGMSVVGATVSGAESGFRRYRAGRCDLWCGPRGGFEAVDHRPATELAALADALSELDGRGSPVVASQRRAGHRQDAPARRAARPRADAAGHLVLSGRAAELERELPFGVVGGRARPTTPRRWAPTGSSGSSASTPASWRPWCPASPGSRRRPAGGCRTSATARTARCARCSRGSARAGRVVRRARRPALGRRRVARADRAPAAPPAAARRAARARVPARAGAARARRARSPPPRASRAVVELRARRAVARGGGRAARRRRARARPRRRSTRRAAATRSSWRSWRAAAPSWPTAPRRRATATSRARSRSRSRRRSPR